MLEQATSRSTVARAVVDRLNNELTEAVDDRILVAMCDGHVASSLRPEDVVERLMVVYCRFDVHPAELGAPPTSYGELGMIAFTRSRAVASSVAARSSDGFAAAAVPFGVGTVAVIFEVQTESETVCILEISSGGRHHRFTFPPVAAIHEANLKEWISYATSRLHGSANHVRT